MPSLHHHQALAKVAACFLIAALGVSGLWAEGGSPARGPSFGETLEVRVINLEVVVGDEAQRVGGLRQEDFQLSVHGEPAAIEFFSEVSDGRLRTAGVPALSVGDEVGTRFLVFIDDYFSLSTERDRVLSAIVSKLPQMGPEDRMAIVAFDGRRLELLSGWSRSLPQLRAAFEQARGRAAFGLQRRGEARRFDATQRFALRSQRGNSFSRIGFAGSGIVTHGLDAGGLYRSKEVSEQVGRVVQAASTTLRGFSQAPGRKVALLLSGGWPVSPEAWLRGTVGEPLREQGWLSGQRLFEPLVDTANRLGFTLYPIATQGLVPAGSSAAVGDVASAAVERELSVGRAELEREALVYLAEETGGRALLGGARLRPLERVIEDTRSYYWLGFTPSWRGDDRGHPIEIEVRVDGRKIRKVRTRSSYLDLSRSSETTMRTEGALLFGQ